ncbi:hypothetical protein K443DRAFT_490579 [Laccaria amethystina LaAM-08-1]|uniref:Uncharacterized protein n=1 Tax=Laccaria amethystina LaAM-08-1 TaxID=1095629 RepID=A0A0C9WUU5_9AGAR|nr:hypothetical protein K443DRAFT_490579 [Laccaria amethystina LaAM-08-1]
MLPAVWRKKNYILNHLILIASSSMPVELGYCQGKDVECGSVCGPTTELPHRGGTAVPCLSAGGMSKPNSRPPARYLGLSKPFPSLSEWRCASDSREAPYNNPSHFNLTVLEI